LLNAKVVTKKPISEEIRRGFAGFYIENLICWSKLGDNVRASPEVRCSINGFWALKKQLNQACYFSGHQSMLQLTVVPGAVASLAIVSSVPLRVPFSIWVK
jgi:hypothetical protein